jgi:hypothetical protein
MASLTRIKILQSNWNLGVDKYFLLTKELDVLMNSKDKRSSEINLLIADINELAKSQQDLDAMISINTQIYIKQELKTFNDNQKVAC